MYININQNIYSAETEDFIINDNNMDNNIFDKIGF